MYHLSLQILELLGHSDLLPLQTLLIVAQIALLKLEQLVDFFREEFHILHHVPQMLGMHGHIRSVSLEVGIGRVTSGWRTAHSFFVQMRKPHVVHK